MDGAFQVMIILLTFVTVEGAFGEAGTIAAVAVTMLEKVLNPIAFLDASLN